VNPKAKFRAAKPRYGYGVLTYLPIDGSFLRLRKRKRKEQDEMIAKYQLAITSVISETEYILPCFTYGGY
jgi:hypothetical protein